ILLFLLLCRFLPRFPNDPVFPFDTPLPLTLLDPLCVFSYLTGNPFFRQPFCGMWVPCSGLEISSSPSLIKMSGENLKFTFLPTMVVLAMQLPLSGGNEYVRLA